MEGNKISFSQEINYKSTTLIENNRKRSDTLNSDETRLDTHPSIPEESKIQDSNSVNITDFQIQNLIGRGSFSKVFRVKLKEN